MRFSSALLSRFNEYSYVIKDKNKKKILKIQKRRQRNYILFKILFYRFPFAKFPAVSQFIRRLSMRGEAVNFTMKKQKRVGNERKNYRCEPASARS